MAEQHKQYAEGKSGELYGYTGKNPPEGTTALVEEDGITLTADGLKYCQKRGYTSPMVATLRVLHDQYHSPAVGQAIAASAPQRRPHVREAEQYQKNVRTPPIRLGTTRQSLQSKCRCRCKKITGASSTLSSGIRHLHNHKEYFYGKKVRIQKRNQKRNRPSP